jgi:hypothetical protein
MTQSSSKLTSAIVASIIAMSAFAATTSVPQAHAETAPVQQVEVQQARN